MIGTPCGAVMISIPSHLIGRVFPVRCGGGSGFSEEALFWLACCEEPNTLLRPNAAAAMTRTPIATGSTHGRTVRRGRGARAGGGAAGSGSTGRGSRTRCVVASSDSFSQSPDQRCFGPLISPVSR